MLWRDVQPQVNMNSAFISATMKTVTPCTKFLREAVRLVLIRRRLLSWTKKEREMGEISALSSFVMFSLSLSLWAFGQSIKRTVLIFCNQHVFLMSHCTRISNILKKNHQTTVDMLKNKKKNAYPRLCQTSDVGTSGETRVGGKRETTRRGTYVSVRTCLLVNQARRAYAFRGSSQRSLRDVCMALSWHVRHEVTLSLAHSLVV